MREATLIARSRGGAVQVQTEEFLFVLEQHHPVRSSTPKELAGKV
jgi:hypothetical protein